MEKDHLGKTTFGKDDNGTFHPGKGKPSGINKEEGLGIQPTAPEDMDEYLELTEKYTAGEDELAENVPLRHRNRNTSKGEDTYKAKENKEESNKSNNQTFSEEETATVVPEELPGILTKELFTELANYQADCCISLFLSTHQSGVGVNERFDPTSFKSALQDIARQLNEKGHHQDTVKRWLEPGYELIRNDEFWLNLSPGLAVFIADGFFKYIKMPSEPAQKIVLESTFYVTPLVPMMQRNEYFYLLVISKQCAKLFRADAYGMKIVPLELPQSIEEVKRLSDLDATTFRTGDSGRRATAMAIPGTPHGAGGGNADDKDNIATYFEAVDDIIFKEVLNKENVPLVLAGVEYLIPIYKDRCDYHNVWEQPLTGNRDRQETGELYAEAKQLMQPYFDQKVNKALELYANRSGGGLTSSIPSDVVPAAYYGRVSHLFVCTGEQLWGTFDEMTSELTIHDTAGENSEDLVDNAVVKTLATGGEVFVLDKEKMPADSCMAALMRY